MPSLGELVAELETPTLPTWCFVRKGYWQWLIETSRICFNAHDGYKWLQIMVGNEIIMYLLLSFIYPASISSRCSCLLKQIWLKQIYIYSIISIYLQISIYRVAGNCRYTQNITKSQKHILSKSAQESEHMCTNDLERTANTISIVLIKQNGWFSNEIAAQALHNWTSIFIVLIVMK